MAEVRIIELRDIGAAEREMAELNVHRDGIKIMAPKSVFRAVKITGLDPRAANILKQDMLSKGGEVALSWKVYKLEKEMTAALAVGTVRQFTAVIPKLKKQPFGLKEVAVKFEAALAAYDSIGHSLTVGGKLLDFAKRAYIMGILNVTPDSFSDGGAHYEVGTAVAWARRMIAEGADIVDVGGESTRPGSEPVEVEKEIERVVPVIREIASSSDAVISIDTNKPEVLEAAVRAGAHMLNDVTGLANPRMIDMVAQLGIPAVVMHMKGTPKTMQVDPVYADLMGEIIDHLRERLEAAERAGVSRQNLLVDPGIGFGKTFDHNLEIIHRLSELKVLGKPIVLGTSRKAFIGKILGIERAAERIVGTAATVALGIANGANIVRVHDVREMKQIAQVTDAILRERVE